MTERSPYVVFTPEQLSADPILNFFSYRHLQPSLAEISAPFCHLAEQIITTLPRSAERTMALRKLLEAKDCAVRAKLS